MVMPHAPPKTGGLIRRSETFHRWVSKIEISRSKKLRESTSHNRQPQPSSESYQSRPSSPEGRLVSDQKSGGCPLITFRNAPAVAAERVWKSRFPGIEELQAVSELLTRQCSSRRTKRGRWPQPTERKGYESWNQVRKISLHKKEPPSIT